MTPRPASAGPAPSRAAEGRVRRRRDHRRKGPHAPRRSAEGAFARRIALRAEARLRSRLAVCGAQLAQGGPGKAQPGLIHLHDRQRSRTQLPETQRLDKWLWFARVTKSRTLAAQLVQDGKVRVNRAKAAKPSQTVRSGDVLTIAVRGSVEVLKVLAPGVRRGPPPEARLLYEVVSSVERRIIGSAAADTGSGRGPPDQTRASSAHRLAKQDG